MRHTLGNVIAVGLILLTSAAIGESPAPRSPSSIGRPLLTASPEQRSAADHLASLFAESWNRRDGNAYGDAYWSDAELVDPSGQIWRGRAAIVQTHIDLWRGPARDTHMTAKVREVRGLTPDLFIVDIDTAATGFSPAPPGAPNGIVRTRLKHVVQKRNGRWRILVSQNTFVAVDR